jgi:hypothetical protein
MDEIQAVQDFRAHLGAVHPATVTAARAALLDAMRSTPLRERARMRRPWVLATAGVVAVGTAIAVVAFTGSSTSSGPRVMSADGSSLYPSQTASDVVSYADQVSVVTAIAEKDVPDANVDPEQEKADGHMVARYITFRVDETVWHRDGAPSLTGTFTAFLDGWWVKGSDRQAFVVDRAPFIEIGARYLTPLAYDGSAWSPIPGQDVFPVQAATVAPSDAQRAHIPLAAQLNGDNLQQAGLVFAAAKPDPLAAQHFDLRPRARAHAVGVARAHHGG